MSARPEFQLSLFIPDRDLLGRVIGMLMGSAEPLRKNTIIGTGRVRSSAHRTLFHMGFTPKDIIGNAPDAAQSLKTPTRIIGDLLAPTYGI